MAAKIVQVIPPPATLGGRSANASHRLSAFLHSLHLISGDFGTLTKLVGSLISVTTDLGVESLLTKLEPFPIASFLPFFEPPQAAPPAPAAASADGFHVAAEEDLRNEEAMFAARPESSLDCLGSGDESGPVPPDRDTETLSFQSSRGVGGLMHIIHNAFKDLGSSMAGYDEHVSNMAVLSKFLREKHTKERLIAKCFSQGTPGEVPLREAIATFNAECYENRWNTVSKCALDLQAVLEALRFGWDMPKYLDGGSAASAQAQGAVAVQEVDRLVRCVFFESYLSMVQSFAKLALHLSAWAESCPCHWHLLTGGRAAAMQSAQRVLLESCPMRGRRGPELSMNVLMQEFAAFSNEGAVRLAQHFPADLPDEKRSSIVHDFELGRSHLTAVISMKTSHFRSMPFKMVGLAYHDEEKAREVWSHFRAVNREDDSSEEANILRRQVPRLLKPNILRQGDLWCLGADMSSCPDFAAEVAALALIPTAERRVEAQHARTQKSSKKSPCHTPSYMSLQIRSADLKAELCGDPKTFVFKLAPFVHECRTYKKAAVRMRLSLHPAMRDAGRATHWRSRDLRDALYRADMISQHQDMPQVFVREPHNTSPQPTLPSVADESSPMGRLLHQLALEHVVSQILEIQASVEGPADSLVFAVSYESQAFSFLREFLLPRHKQQDTPMLTFSDEVMEAEADALVERSTSPKPGGMDVLFQKLSLAETSEQRLTGVFFQAPSFNGKNEAVPGFSRIPHAQH